MKRIHTLTESDLNRIVKTVLENFNASEYEDEDFIEVFLNYFRPWVKKTHGDEVGQYPLSLLIKTHINEFIEDYGIENNSRVYGSYRNMANVGRELAIKGVHRMPNLKKEGLFTDKFKKAITFFTDRLNLPEWMTLELTEDSPYKVYGRFIVDWDKAIHDKSEEPLNASKLSTEFMETLTNFIGVELGSPTHGKLDLNIGGSFVYEGIDEWIAKTLNKEIKKKIRALPNSHILHSVKFGASNNSVGGYISLTFKSNGWRNASEFTDDVRNLISELGYNTEILRVSR
jgi:catechol 2,3-dioxygenase-like lactoylglutathione lyase family enzyme